MFTEGLECGKDGSFKEIIDADGKLLDKVRNYKRILNKVIGIDMVLPERLVEHRGKVVRDKYSEEAAAEAFTYAFTNSKEEGSFSYTIFPKKHTTK